MAETLYATSHISGSASTPANATGAPNGVATTDSGNVSWTSRWAIGDPSGNLSGTQSITVRAREAGGSSSGAKITVTLYENGASVTTLVSSETLTGGTAFTDYGPYTFDGSLISNSANVEIEISAATSGGGPSNRRTAQIDSITLLAEVALPTTPVSASRSTSWNNLTPVSDAFQTSWHDLSTVSRDGDKIYVPPLSEFTLRATIPDNTVNWSISLETLTHTESPSFPGFGGRLMGSLYRGPDGTTLVQNSAGYTGNGNAEQVNLGEWTQTQWNYVAGPGIRYIDFRYTTDATYAGPGAIHEVRNVAVLADGVPVPFTPLSEALVTAGSPVYTGALSTEWNVAGVGAPTPVSRALATSWNTLEPLPINLLTLEQASGLEANSLATSSFYRHATSTVSSSTDFAASGSRSLKVEVPGGNTQRVSISTYQPNVTGIVEGNTYTATFKIRAAAGNNPSDNNAFFAYLWWYNSSGGAISTTYGDGSSVTATSDGWVQAKSTAVAPAGAAQARVLIYRNPNCIDAATYYVDEVGFWEGSSGQYADPPLVSQNQATGGDTLSDTTGFTSAGSATLSYATDQAHGSAGSIKAVTPGSNAAWEGCNVSLPAGTLTAGLTYRLSMWVRVDAAGTYQFSGVNSWRGTLFTNSVPLNANEWTKVEADFTAVTANEAGQVTTYGLKAWSSTPRTIWTDDVTVTAVYGGALAAVSKAIATTWNALAQVSDTLANSWNARSIVSAARSSLWGVRQYASAARSTLWNALASVSSTRSTSWSVRKVVAAARSTLWDVASPFISVAASRSTSWITRAQVGSTRATSWGVRSTISRAVSTSFGVRALISKAASTSWNARATVSAARATSWNILKTVTDAVATSWGVRKVVTAARGTSWNVDGFLAAVSRAVSTSWKVVGRISASRATSWHDLETVGTQRSTRWNVRSLIAKATATSWNALAHTASSVKAASWNVRQYASSSTSTSWNVREVVSKAVGSSWNALSTVAGAIGTAWHTLYGLITPTILKPRAKISATQAKASLRPASSPKASIKQASRATARIERNVD